MLKKGDLSYHLSFYQYFRERELDVANDILSSRLLNILLKMNSL